MELLKKAKNALIGISVVYLVIGIIMVIMPVFVSNFICYVIGALLIVGGGSGIFTYIRAGVDGFLAKITLLIAVLFTVLGIYILINPEGFVSIIPIVVGIMLVIESFDKISTTLSARKNGYQDWLKMLIPSVIIFILGLILILNPFESVTVFIRVIGIFLIIDAISNVYLAYNYGKI